MKNIFEKYTSYLYNKYIETEKEIDRSGVSPRKILIVVFFFNIINNDNSTSLYLYYKVFM